MSAALLEFHEVDVFYESIQALKKVSLQVNEGETVSLVGANSADKSTLLMSILGQPRTAARQILYRGQDIRQESAYYMASNDIAQSPERRRMFPDMSVEENLSMDTIPVSMDHAEEDVRCVFGLFLHPKERRDQCTMTIPGSKQRMLATAHALMNRSKLLLLDELSLGLVPIAVKQVFRTLHGLAGSGMTIFLVEQNVNHALRLSGHAYMTVTGKTRTSGNDEELLGNQEMHSAHLGGY